jgi:membrane-bound lytic murein transglycosylase D
MPAIKVIFALSLVVSGMIGCASTERLYHRTASNTVQLPQIKPSPEKISPDPSPPAANLQPSSANAPATTERLPPPRNPLAPPREVEPLSPKPLETKAERVDSREKTLPVPAKTSSSTAQRQGAFQADNRLLELLEKEIDKAVEQPPERRRLQFSKEVVGNPKVRHFLHYYSVTAKNSFEELLARSGKYMPMIAAVLAREGLPKELGYLALLESQFVLDSTSRNGAAGLWQFVPSTARQYGLRIDSWVDERRDPVKSTRAAAAYLKDLHDYYGRWFLATAAYNAGPGNVDKALRQSQAKDFWSIKAKAELSEETRNFVPKFIAIALIASDPYKHGFQNVQYHAALDYEEVELPFPLQLASLAELAETETSTLKALNPALLKETTPPGEIGFRVNLPVGRAVTFLAKAKEKSLEKDEEPIKVVTHEVKRGETLFSIARYYGSTVRALMELNGLTTSQLRIGQKLGILLQGLRATLR